MIEKHNKSFNRDDLSLKYMRSAGAALVVIKGEGLDNESSDTVASLLSQRLGLRSQTVRLDELGTTELGDVKLLYFPGGDYLSVRLPEGAVNSEQLHRHIQMKSRDFI